MRERQAARASKLVKNAGVRKTKEWPSTLRCGRTVISWRETQGPLPRKRSPSAARVGSLADPCHKELYGNNFHPVAAEDPRFLATHFSGKTKASRRAKTVGPATGPAHYPRGLRTRVPAHPNVLVPERMSSGPR